TQLAVSVVAPRMIGATETHRAGAASFDDARPAMATDVCECAQPAIIVACHQDRRRPESIGEVIAGFLDAATEAGDHRILAKQDLALAPGPLRRGIGARIVASEDLGHWRDAAIDRFQRLANESHLCLMVH